MTEPSFWKRLDAQAIPNIKAELDRLGWELIEAGAHCWVAERKYARNRHDCLRNRQDRIQRMTSKELMDGRRAPKPAVG